MQLAQGVMRSREWRAAGWRRDCAAVGSDGEREVDLVKRPFSGGFASRHLVFSCLADVDEGFWFQSPSRVHRSINIYIAKWRFASENDAQSTAKTPSTNAVNACAYLKPLTDSVGSAASGGPINIEEVVVEAEEEIKPRERGRRARRRRGLPPIRVPRRKSRSSRSKASKGVRNLVHYSCIAILLLFSLNEHRWISLEPNVVLLIV
ncbi:hypothetical protein AXF42_Ash013029 [Apostasia shenzhenica]|uniref:Uncharacterized protein n=1 Tax=Apostasia shenzhenica TaxID=1088818 RepID=A0A2I0ARX5_9ASPA|nr:hypothetical protein AXF42_Ash013029 [Apostasia shenzhenica]